jgi:hypothetical protein
MELTNLIWHLASAVAALWAGFAYRLLSLRHSELRQAVVLSMLQIQQSDDHLKAAPALEARYRSLRVRALRWICQEYMHERRIVLQVEDSDSVIGLEQAMWNRALGLLMAVLTPVPGSEAATGFVDAQGEMLSAEKLAAALKQAKDTNWVLKLKWQAAGLAGKGGWQCLG